MLIKESVDGYRALITLLRIGTMGHLVGEFRVV